MDMPSLVFLPGMMCDARLFAPQISALSSRMPVACACFVTQSSVAGMARSVLAAAPERFALAGLSMGGIVAMEVLRQAPERVAALALMATNPLAEVAAVQAGRAPQIARAEAGGLMAMMNEVFLPRYAGAGPLSDDIQQTCRDMAESFGPKTFVAQSLALRDRPDQCDTLAAFRGRALILNGTADQLCPPERHDLMAQLMPQATHATIEGAGHLPTLETPQRVTDALREMMEPL